MTWLATVTNSTEALNASVDHRAAGSQMDNRLPHLFVDIDSVSNAFSARLLVAITFHFIPLRLGFLEKVLRSIARFPIRTRHVVIYTNAVTTFEQVQILEVVRAAAFIPGRDAELKVVPSLVYPYLLTWAHKTLISETFDTADNEYSHFAYLEDDEELTFDNFAYFVAARELLRPFRMIPSYARVEWSMSRGCYVSVDSRAQISLAIRPSIANGKYAFVEMDNSYSGTFILDRELALEYLVSYSFDRELSRRRSHWQVRERAAMGLTFESPPAPFLFRSVVPVSISTHAVPSCAWLTHLPNNHAQNPNTSFGKTSMAELFSHDFNAAEAIQASAGRSADYRLYGLKTASLENLRQRCERFCIAGRLRLRTLYRRFFPTESAQYGIKATGERL